MDIHLTPKVLIEESEEEEEALDLNQAQVTIVEEDGTTSVVNDASVSTVIHPNSSLQFGQHSGATYRVVEGSSLQTTSSGIQLVQPTINGQQYYILNSTDIGRNGGGRIIDARRISPNKQAVRDEKKRATHNLVERRRRDKINGWINKLAKIVPSCNSDESKQGQSKGGILAKACEYINELKSTNLRLTSTLQEGESAVEELGRLLRENGELRRENQLLKQQLGPTENDSTVEV